MALAWSCGITTILPGPLVGEAPCAAGISLRTMFVAIAHIGPGWAPVARAVERAPRRPPRRRPPRSTRRGPRPRSCSSTVHSTGARHSHAPCGGSPISTSSPTTGAATTIHGPCPSPVPSTTTSPTSWPWWATGPRSWWATPTAVTSRWARRSQSPQAIRAVGAYEPPLPWCDWWPRRTASSIADEDPATFAEGFFRRVVGDAGWDRLTDQARADRQADGPALVAELSDLRRHGPPFDLARSARARWSSDAAARRSRITGAPSTRWPSSSPMPRSSRSPAPPTVRRSPIPTPSPPSSDASSSAPWARRAPRLEPASGLSGSVRVRPRPRRFDVDVVGKPEHALGDDVALDLGGAAPDGERPREEIPLGPHR